MSVVEGSKGSVNVTVPFVPSKAAPPLAKVAVGSTFVIVAAPGPPRSA
jgi:hypothetical protein